MKKIIKRYNILLLKLLLICFGLMEDKDLGIFKIFIILKGFCDIKVWLSGLFLGLLWFYLKIMSIRQ